MMLALAHGAGPSIAVAQPEQLKPAVKHCMAEVKKRKPWMTHKQPEPWAAILVSDNTRVFYGRSAGQVEDRYLANVFRKTFDLFATPVSVEFRSDRNPFTEGRREKRQSSAHGEATARPSG